MPDLLAVVAAVTTWQGVAALAVLTLGPQAITYIQGRRTKALAGRAATDAAATREQTENEHQDHPTPNMRQQLDAQDAQLVAQVEAIGEIRTLLTDHIEHAGAVDKRRDAWQTSMEQDLAHRRRPLLAWRR